MENYFVVQKFMVSELGLKGNERDVFAIIYGFTQDGETKYTGSRQYLADMIGCSIRCISAALDSLVEKELIIKENRIINGMNMPMYSVCKSCIGGEKSAYPREKSAHNNIYNNITNNKLLDNSNNTKVLPDNNEKPKKKNLYEKCIDEIDNSLDDKKLPNDQKLHNALVRYLDVRLAMKDKPLYGVNQWKGLLNSLASMQGDKLKIVNQSIERGWAIFVDTNSTYKNSKYTGPNVFGEFGEVKSARYTDEQKEKDENWRRENGIESF